VEPPPPPPYRVVAYTDPHGAPTIGFQYPFCSLPHTALTARAASRLDSAASTRAPPRALVCGTCFCLPGPPSMPPWRRPTPVGPARGQRLPRRSLPCRPARPDPRLWHRARAQAAAGRGARASTLPSILILPLAGASAASCKGTRAALTVGARGADCRAQAGPSRAPQHSLNPPPSAISLGDPARRGDKASR